MNKKQETAPVRFSACSHCFLPFMNFEQICGLLQQKGFDALEVIGEPARIKGNSLKKIIQDSGLSVSCITASGRRGTNRDLSSPRHSIRSATVEHFQRCVDLAAQLECHTITVVPMEIGKFEPESSKHEELEWIAKGLRDIQQHAHQCGVNVTLEILNRRSAHSLNTVAEVVSFFANHDLQLGLTLDLFHMGQEESSFSEAFRKAEPHLMNLQMADSNRAGLGHGAFNLQEIFSSLAKIEYRGFISFEAEPHRTAPSNSSDRELVLGYVDEFIPTVRKYYRK